MKKLLLAISIFNLTASLSAGGILDIFSGAPKPPKITTQNVGLGEQCGSQTNAWTGEITIKNCPSGSYCDDQSKTCTKYGK